MKTIAEQLNVKEFPFVIRDKNDNRIYTEYYDKSWYKREYDSNGNEIYFEDNYGFWSRIYYEDSSEFWCKREFDDKSNLISYKDSNGKWEKYEYDSNLNKIYHETNEGVILDKRVTELTLNQIAEKFGIEVSQLKIKK